MTGRRKKESRAMSATDFMAQLQRDEKYKAEKAAFDAELEDRVNRLRAAEQPIVADLRASGIYVESVWDLVNTAQPYPTALPVLVDHLERGGYPDRVMQGLGRALAVKPAISYWSRLKAAFLTAVGSEEREGIAVALAASATEVQLEDLIHMVSLEERGPSRVFFLRPILQLGGERGRAILESLTDDSTLGQEALALLGQHS